MLFRSLLNRLNALRGAKRSRRAMSLPGAFRPAIETLEDRLTPTAMLTISDVYVLEGNDGVQNAHLTVSLTEPHGNNVTVNYSTVNGSAVAGSDFTAVSGKGVQVWDVDSGLEVLSLNDPKENVHALVLSANGNRLAGVDKLLGKVWIWDATPLPETKPEPTRQEEK